MVDFARVVVQNKDLASVYVSGTFIRDFQADELAGWSARVNAQQFAGTLSRAHEAAVKEAVVAEGAKFKNFHRRLCARFGYHHDEADWERDQASLEEHIASQLGGGGYSSK